MQLSISRPRLSTEAPSSWRAGRCAGTLGGVHRDEQAGVITRRQAIAGGLTEEQIRARLRSGRWQRTSAGIYSMFAGRPSRAAVLWAALLPAGPGVVLSHQTAAELLGPVDHPEVDGRAAHDDLGRDRRRDQTGALRAG